MVNDVGEAIGTVAGMILAGYILVRLGQQLETTAPVNMESWGIIFITLGGLAGVVLIFAVIKSAVS